MKLQKVRLDQLLAEKYSSLSKTVIQSLIMQGKVTVNGKTVTKPGTMVYPDIEYTVDLTEPKYVSRAGYKLEKALEHFGIDVHGKVVLDAGLSTGGFADCLLQHGVSKVYGIDVGYGQVHEKIAHDPRLVIMERTNLRTLGGLPEKVDLVTLDLSFISVLKVMEAVVQNMKSASTLIVLIKPQFEAGKKYVGKGGIITDPQIHQQVIESVVHAIELYGFKTQGVIESPLLGAEGNKEFLACFVRKI